MKSKKLFSLIHDFLASPILGTTLSFLSIVISFALVNQSLGMLTAVFVSSLITLSFIALLVYFYLKEKPTTSFFCIRAKLTWYINKNDDKSSCFCLHHTLKCLHNNIYTYTNRSYGDAVSVSTSSSCGKPIHTYFDGGKRYDIFFLKKVYNRGDIFDMQVFKSMMDAFPANEEWVETEILLETDQIELSLVFPAKRHPAKYEDVWLVHKFAGSTNTSQLPSSCFSYSENGNMIITYSQTNPKLGSMYQIRWYW